MVKQAENICRQATVQLRNPKTELQKWRALKEQLFNKFTLRLVSCVQLASKLSFHYKVRSRASVGTECWKESSSGKVAVGNPLLS